MNKIPRFMTEYANYKIKEAVDLIYEYPHNEKIYNKAIEKAHYAVFNYQYGYITIDEAMKQINEAFSD